MSFKRTAGYLEEKANERKYGHKAGSVGKTIDEAARRGEALLKEQTAEVRRAEERATAREEEADRRSWAEQEDEAAAKKRARLAEAAAHRECPRCKESIKRFASMCRFCQLELLDQAELRRQSDAAPAIASELGWAVDRVIIAFAEALAEIPKFRAEKERAEKERQRKRDEAATLEEGQKRASVERREAAWRAAGHDFRLVTLERVTRPLRPARAKGLTERLFGFFTGGNSTTVDDDEAAPGMAYSTEYFQVINALLEALDIENANPTIGVALSSLPLGIYVKDKEGHYRSLYFDANEDLCFGRRVDIADDEVEVAASYQRGCELARAGKLDDAEVELRMAVKLQPGNPDILVALARILLSNDRYDRTGTLPLARLLVDRAVDIAPNHSDAADFQRQIIKEMS